MMNNISPMGGTGGSMSTGTDRVYLSALQDFHKARKRTAVNQILGRLKGNSLELLSFQEVLKQLKEAGRSDRGLQDIPVEAIVGSVGRQGDFDRAFSPRHVWDAERWARVKVAGMGQRALPPIEVYQIGDSYFVSDGNHRVSIAREQGFEFISAMVIEVRTRAPLPADADPDDLILAAEYADFLEHSSLDRVRPQADVRLSVPGQYEKLENHIALHRCYLEANDVQVCRTTAEATRLWHDEAYLPVVEVIREQGYLRQFPGWTESDLYLWVTENQETLRQELGWTIKPESAVANLAGDIGRGVWKLHVRTRTNVFKAGKAPKVKGRPPRQSWMQRESLNRYSHTLFNDILVPVKPEMEPARGEGGSLGQALVVAGKEGRPHGMRGDAGRGGRGEEEGRPHGMRGDAARGYAGRGNTQIFGLCVVEEGDGEMEAAALGMGELFERRCRDAGVEGVLAVELGSFAPVIGQRAVMVDLLVLDRRFLADDKAHGGRAVDTLRILKRADRPVMLTGRRTSPLSRILVALDGRSGIGTTLFAATYQAERWGSELIVLSQAFNGHGNRQRIEEVEGYLVLHEVEATFLPGVELSAETIAETAAAQECDLIVMNWPGTGRIIGRAPEELINLMIDSCRQPILICP